MSIRDFLFGLDIHLTATASAGFTIVLRYARWPEEGDLPAKRNDGFLLMWCDFKFEGILFRSDSRHNDRVDSLWECATKQAVMTVAQWHRNKLLGVSGYWQNKLRWIHAYVVQF